MTTNLDVFNSTNATNYYHLVTAVNTASDGVFGMLLLATTFIFLLVSLKQSGLELSIDNWIATSFLTFIVAILLWTINIVTFPVMMIPFSLFIISFILKFFQP